MTSNFEPFSILFNDHAPSLSSVALLTCTSHLLLPPLTIFNLVSASVLTVRHNAHVSVNSYVFIENVQWIVQSEGSSIAVTVCPVIS
jgi:hypothetical protein